MINFKDKPVEPIPINRIVTIPDGQGGFIYQIEARAVDRKDEASLRAELLSIIEPISGEVVISKYEAVRDKSGHIRVQKVWVRK